MFSTNIVYTLPKEESNIVNFLKKDNYVKKKTLNIRTTRAKSNQISTQNWEQKQHINDATTVRASFFSEIQLITICKTFKFLNMVEFLNDHYYRFYRY